MELRYLRYFVAVAEEENISRAAKRLHVSQPPLSRQIRDLESELGVSLFEHGSKAIHLTEAGQIFLNEARAALLRVDDAVSFTKAFAQRKRNRVRVGYGAVPTSEVLPRALRAFRRTNPQAKSDLRAMTTEEMIRALSSGDIDVSLMADGLPEDLGGLTVEELCTYPLRVATSKNHRFARVRVVPIAEVAKEPIIALTRDGFRWYRAMVERLLSPFNPSFKIMEEYDNTQSLIAAVEAGHGVAIGWSVVAHTAGERLAFRPLRPEPRPLPIVLAYRQEGTSPLVEAFVAAAKSVRIK
jgi:LysR family transcriptional regulator, benzoate and cis,cis-muconate-responsive activator of ben and cat genes